jgi:hypothetical protein
VTAVRLWVLLDTVLPFGIRASEVDSIRVGDCLRGHGQASLVLRQGKAFQTPATRSGSSPPRGSLAKPSLKQGQEVLS